MWRSRCCHKSATQIVEDAERLITAWNKRVIHDSMGRDAFDAAAANVVIAVCGILGHECGHDRLIRLLDLVEDVSRRIDESQAS